MQMLYRVTRCVEAIYGTVSKRIRLKPLYKSTACGTVADSHEAWGTTLRDVIYGEEVLKPMYSEFSRREIPHENSSSMHFGWMNGKGKPLKAVTYMDNTFNSFQNNEHGNTFYRVILEQLDFALHNKGMIADATRAKEIMTGLAGQLGFYMGLIPTGYLPVISGDQKTSI